MFKRIVNLLVGQNATSLMRENRRDALDANSHQILMTSIAELRDVIDQVVDDIRNIDRRVDRIDDKIDRLNRDHARFD
jgi:Mg2+ and Co2+ transporter CorA